MHHFGAGIVRRQATGFRGDPPTHPELLDYLAVKFVESGWSPRNLADDDVGDVPAGERSLTRRRGTILRTSCYGE
jgi:hypothetical protein